MSSLMATHGFDRGGARNNSQHVMRRKPDRDLWSLRGRQGGAAVKLLWVVGAAVLVALVAVPVRGLMNGGGAGTGQGAESGVVKSIGALAELNGLGDEVNAVFILLPAKGSEADGSICQAMEGARRTIEDRYGIKVGLFRLRPGTEDYGDIAEKMAVPGVVAIVRTGARGFVTGAITEAKLVDGFGAAAAGCCPFGEPDAKEASGK